VCIYIYSFGYLLKLVENLAVLFKFFQILVIFFPQKSLNLQQKYFKEFSNSTEIWHPKKNWQIGIAWAA
jgi:hypothetical protein